MTQETKPQGRPKRTDKDNTKVPSSERSTKLGDKRKTYIVDITLSEKIDEIAHLERTSVKTVVHEAFTNHVDNWESKNGKIKLPDKK